MTIELLVIGHCAKDLHGTRTNPFWCPFASQLLAETANVYTSSRSAAPGCSHAEGGFQMAGECCLSFNFSLEPIAKNMRKPLTAREGG